MVVVAIVAKMAATAQWLNITTFLSRHLMAHLFKMATKLADKH